MPLVRITAISMEIASVITPPTIQISSIFSIDIRKLLLPIILK